MDESTTGPEQSLVAVDTSHDFDSHRFKERILSLKETFRDQSRIYDDLVTDFHRMNELLDQTRKELNEEARKRKEAEQQVEIGVQYVKILQEENEKNRVIIDKLWDAKVQSATQSMLSGDETDIMNIGRIEEVDDSIEVPRDSERSIRTLRRSSIRIFRKRSVSADILNLTEKPYVAEKLVMEPHCFRELSETPIYAAEGREDEAMYPRCGTLRPYLLWERQFVPDTVDDEWPITKVSLLSRVYCNCGMPLTQEDDFCDCPQHQSRRHNFFYRKNFYDFKSRPLPISLPDGTPWKNVILPSLSSINKRGAPTSFDLVAQMSNLFLERRPAASVTDAVPPCIITVWDGTVPPNSIGTDKFLRDITTPADKMVLGGPLPWDMPAMVVNVRLAKARKVEAGEFVILRDVIIIKAYSVGNDNGLLSPVWMLQARDMEVIRGTPKDPGILAAFLKVAKQISTIILLMGVEGDEMNEETWKEEGSCLAYLDGRMKRKSKESRKENNDEPAAKRPELDDGNDAPQTWMTELAERDEAGIEQDTTISLKSTFGSFNPPTAVFESFPENQAKFAEFIRSLHVLLESPRKHVWLSWMSTCRTRNRIREHMPSNTGPCCKEGCDGGTNMYVHIPVLPHPDARFIHLLIDAAHFRKDNKHIPRVNWNRKKERNQIADVEKIFAKINESSIVLHRAMMMELFWKVVYVVPAEQGWITVVDREITTAKN